MIDIFSLKSDRDSYAVYKKKKRKKDRGSYAFILFLCDFLQGYNIK